MTDLGKASEDGWRMEGDAETAAAPLTEVFLFLETTLVSVWLAWLLE